jgi:hypothetical protein
VSIGGHMADGWRFGPPEAPIDYPLGKAARHWLTRTLQAEVDEGLLRESEAIALADRFMRENQYACFRVAEKKQAMQRARIY